jgi:hypothetical protein
MPIYQTKEITMNQQNLIIQAINLILMNDLDDEFIGTAIKSQVELLAGLTADSSEPNYDFH